MKDIDYRPGGAVIGVLLILIAWSAISTHHLLNQIEKDSVKKEQKWQYKELSLLCVIYPAVGSLACNFTLLINNNSGYLSTLWVASQPRQVACSALTNNNKEIIWGGH